MYADVSQVANELTKSIVQVNISKTVCNSSCSARCFCIRERLQVVTEYKYLVDLIDSRLSFKAQVKKVCNRVKFSLLNFRFIRDCMSTEAAMTYEYSMVISHIIYSLSTCSQASTTLKPFESLYK